MDMKHVAPSLKSIRIVNGALKDGGEMKVVYVRTDKLKKRTKMKPLEKLSRRFARAQVSAGQAYLGLHESSNEKKKDGWLKDRKRNLRKARKIFVKQLRG